MTAVNETLPFEKDEEITMAGLKNVTKNCFQLARDKKETKRKVSN